MHTFRRRRARIRFSDSADSTRASICKALSGTVVEYRDENRTRFFDALHGRAYLTHSSSINLPWTRGQLLPTDMNPFAIIKQAYDLYVYRRKYIRMFNWKTAVLNGERAPASE